MHQSVEMFNLAVLGIVTRYYSSTDESRNGTAIHSGTRARFSKSRVTTLHRFAQAEAPKPWFYWFFYHDNSGMAFWSPTCYSTSAVPRPYGISRRCRDDLENICTEAYSTRESLTAIVEIV